MILILMLPDSRWAPLVLWLILLSLFQLFIPSSRRGERRLRSLFLIHTAIFAAVDTLLPRTFLSETGYFLFIAALILGRGLLIAGWARSDVPLPRAAGGRLRQEGIYRRIRHPRYGGVLVIAAGLAFRRPSLLLALVWLPLLLQVLRLIRHEERVMERRFGEEWRAYRGRAGIFLPRIGGRG